MDNHNSQFSVFYLKQRWLLVLVAILSFLTVIWSVWREVMYLKAGQPGNLHTDTPLFNFLEGSTDGLSTSKFNYRLIFYNPYMIFFGTYIFFVSIHGLFFTKLKIGQPGIEYYAVGYSVKASWSDIEKLGEKRYGLRRSKGFFLKDGTYKQKWKWVPLNLKNASFIPLNDFGIDIAGVEALKLINQNAPDLGIFDH